MAVAWANGCWANGSWLGINAGPPNAWRGATSPVPSAKTGGDDVPRRWKKNPNKGFNLAEWKRRAQIDDDIGSTIESIWARLSGLPAEAKEEAAEIAAPVLKRNAAKLDLRKLAREPEVQARMLEFDQRVIAWFDEDEDDDDDIVMMLMQ